MTILERSQPAVGKDLVGGDAFKRAGGPEEDFGVETEEGMQRPDLDESEWLQRGKMAYWSSTTYVDTNYRKKWEDSIRAFNNTHPADSKYMSPAYAKRSNIFRPKTRATIRKNESAAAAAFFSNMDVVDCEAENQGNKTARISAEIMKSLLTYRLRNAKVGIPWFQFVLGGLQDAQTTGVACAHVYWDYKEVGGQIKVDKPCAKLIPVENIRIDPGSDWTDPIGTSPYVIELIPMWVVDVKEMMVSPDKKTGQAKWRRYSDGMIAQAQQDKSDSTRLVRNKDRSDPMDPDDRPIDDYSIVWIQRHIHRHGGQDYEFYMLGEIALLTDPRPLEETVFHGERPYVMGTAILETHKVFPSGVPELSKGLQDETNEIANQRLDNIKFVLNKKWFVKRGKNVDVASLVRNVPGGVTLADDPDGDIREINWPDVTGSAYAEQDRINADMNDLLGDFSPAQAQLARRGNEPARNMMMQAQSSSPLVAYLLMTYVNTFVTPVLRLLAKLEQHYETDQVVLAIAADNAKLFQKYGIDQVTDDLLNHDLSINVNMSMGSTDPTQKMNKLGQAISMIQGVTQAPPPGMDVSEFIKEIMGFAGYQDGRRFFGEQDPEKVQLQQKLQHAGQVIQELSKRIEDKQGELQAKKDIAHEGNVTKLLVEDHRQTEENKRALASHLTKLSAPQPPATPRGPHAPRGSHA